VLNLDAANAKQGLRPFANGCASSDLNWFDLSSSAITGTLNSFASCGASTGWNGSGISSDPFRLNFNGTSNYVTTTLSSIYQSFTLGAWVKPSFTAGDRMDILSKVSYYATSTNDFPIGLYLNAAGTTATVYIDSGNDWNADLYVTSPAFANDAWHYIVATYDGSTLKIYVDGAAPTTATGSVTLATGSRNWSIGRVTYEQAGGGFGKTYFKGSIATATIYNRAISDPEISQNCKAQQSRFSGVVCN
jgi:hypothetical protein